MRENRNTPFHSVALQKVQDENGFKILNGIDIVNRIWSMGWIGSVQFENICSNNESSEPYFVFKG